MVRRIRKTLLVVYLALWKYQPFSIRRRFLISLSLIWLSILLSLILPWCLKWVVDSFNFPNGIKQVIWLLIAYGTLWLFSQLLGNFRQLVAYQAFESGIHRFCFQVFKHLLLLPMNFYSRHAIGEILNTLERAQFAIPTIIAGMLFVVIPTLTEIILSFVLIAYYYNLVYVSVLVVILGMYAGFTLYTMNWVVNAQREGNKQHQIVSRYVADVLMNIDSVHYQCGEDTALKHAECLLQRREDAVTSQLIRNDVIGLVQKCIAGLGLIGNTIWIGYQVTQHNLTPGDFILFNSYLLQFLAPLNTLGFVGRDIREGLTKMEPVIDILEEPLTITDCDSPKVLSYQPYNIQFMDVSFSYPQTIQPILKEVSFEVVKGKTLAIVGHNGSGKSTIVKLIYRLYEPTKGNILIGGYDIKQLRLSFLRTLIGIVPQDVFLLNGTIQENLFFGLQAIQQLDEILEITNLDKWIRTLPKGINTEVGERGMKLSGGEKRRIGIARALLRNPQILILDEAEVSLDIATEIQIFNHLQQTYQDITKIVITHNKRIADMADTVIYLNKNVVVPCNKAEVSEHYFGNKIEGAEMY